MVADGAAPKLRAGHAGHLAEDVPQGDVDAGDRGGPLDAVAVPEVLADHHLPEVFDPGRVRADDERGEILDRPHDAAGVPFERGLAPAPEPGLIGDDLHEHPVPHPCVADVGFDGGDLHGGGVYSK
jgi:hypothetical protein